MVSFLTTLILALIIFVPACMGVSKFFRLSDQAKDNFNNFVKEIQSLAKDGKEGENRNDVLILDQATAAVYFEPNSEEVKVEVNADFWSWNFPTDYTIYIKPPGKCEKGKGCLCLIRKAKFDATWWELAPSKVIITEDTSTPAICKTVDTKLILSKCGIGVPTKVKSYTCSGGFMIERQLAKDSSWITVSYYEANRRTFFVLTKAGDSIKLTPQT